RTASSRLRDLRLAEGTLDRHFQNRALRVVGVDANLTFELARLNLTGVQRHADLVDLAFGLSHQVGLEERKGCAEALDHQSASAQLAHVYHRPANRGEIRSSR